MNAPAARDVCRLQLIINNVLYALRRLGPRSWSLHREDGPRYRVLPTARGPECSCPDHIWRRGVAGCKHIRALIAAGLLDPPAAAGPRRRR
jgi:hypothetical protein